MVDVALAAGVSLKTVSRHVNGATNIAPELDDRIRQAIRDLRYRRNLSAASIRPGRRSGVVGVIIEDIGNPFYSTLVRGIEGVLEQAGILLLSASSEEDGSRHDLLMESLLERRVDGLIVVPPRRCGTSWSGTPGLPPIVYVDRPGPMVEADVVVADDFGGAVEATSLLVTNGARRVAFVGDSLEIATMAERRRGYRSALAAAGLAADPDAELTDRHDVAAAARAVTSLLLGPAAPDGLFCANNRSSLGALHAFRAIGRRIPMVGFDDFEAATVAQPAVSVVSQDAQGMGRRAAEQLMRRISGDAQPPQRIVLPTQVTQRGSERP